MEIGYYKYDNFYIVVCDEVDIGTVKEYFGHYVYRAYSDVVHTHEMLEEIAKVVRAITNMNR